MITISLSFFIPAVLVLLFIRNLFIADLMLLPFAASLYFSYSPMVVLGQQYLPNHVALLQASRSDSQ